MTEIGARDNLTGMKITVVGFGRSGISAAVFLNDRGAEVTVTDLKNEKQLKDAITALGNRKIKIDLGNDGSGAVRNAETVILSPGVPGYANAVTEAKRRGIEIIGEVELFWRFCPCPVIAVTGTNGKSTTVMLIDRLLKNLGLKVQVGGNVGIPLTGLVKKIDSNTIVVAEISSFQLEHIVKFHPYISVMLNLGFDHLDRHKSFDSYVNAKKRIFMNQNELDWAVCNGDDKNVLSMLRCAKARVLLFSGKSEVVKCGVFVKSGKIVVSCEGELEEICSVNEIKLMGLHNLENILAVVAVGMIYGANHNVVRETITHFDGIEHRLEYVAEIDGVRYFNDSKATNVDACLAALKSFSNPLVIICGGRDKGSDYKVLTQYLRNNVKLAILIGESSSKMQDAFEGAVECRAVNSLGEAVQCAHSAAVEGDTVLLSPACSSFDMFADFEERGRNFKSEVGKL